MFLDHYSELSEQGKAQYDKYSDYYEDKYWEYGDSVDFISLIESDAKEHKKYKEKS